MISIQTRNKVNKNFNYLSLIMNILLQIIRMNRGPSNPQNNKIFNKINKLINKANSRSKRIHRRVNKSQIQINNLTNNYMTFYS